MKQKCSQALFTIFLRSKLSIQVGLVKWLSKNSPVSSHSENNLEIHLKYPGMHLLDEWHTS